MAGGFTLKILCIEKLKFYLKSTFQKLKLKKKNLKIDIL